MLEIALAPVGAGKTETALTALRHTLQQKPFARVWVLLATQRQQDAFRQRLVEQSGGEKLFMNVEFFDFYALYRRLLNIAQIPAYGLGDAARYGVLRTVMQRLGEENLPLYTPVAQTPGFIRIVGELIYELKQNRVLPETFLNAAQSPKDRELALIYAEYQAILTHYDLVDREGEGWLALDSLPQLPVGRLALDLLIVDGYDQFTPVQAQLIARLSDYAAQSLVTLTTVPAREDTIGRRFQKALETLQATHATISLQTVQETGATRHPDLAHLIENIFLPHVDPIQPTGGLHLIEAPDPSSEVAAVLREVKRLLLAGCPPDAIMIALRDWQRYQPYFVAWQDAYQLPLVLHHGEALATNPLIIALMKLLTLPQTDYHQRDLLDTLNSPYFQVPELTPTHRLQLEQISQQFKVISGADIWFEALDYATRPTYDADNRESPPLLTKVQAAEIEFGLATLFEHLTPPEEATLSEYVAWLEDLMGADPQDPDAHRELPYHLNMIDIARDTDDETSNRDLLALETFKQILRGLLATEQLLTSLNEGEVPLIPWQQCLSQLQSAVESARITTHPGRSGRVLVTTASNARGLPHQYVFLLGLAEGIFPAPTPEDPLYLDSERRHLAAQNVPLVTAAERANDDGLFYELISLARTRLTLTRPTADDGAAWAPSHLWRAVTQRFDQTPQRIRAGEVVAPHDAAALSEAALIAAAGLATPTPSDDLRSLYNWLLDDQPAYWGHIHHNRNLETRRLSRRPHNEYSGQLTDPTLIDLTAQKYAQNHLWSATQLNDFGVCPFRFFAARLLKLEALTPPEVGTDVLQSGSITHAILERTYQAILDAGLSIEPAHLPAAEQFLDAAADAVLKDAPARYGFRASALWEHEQTLLRERLLRLVQLDFSPENPIAKQFGDQPRRPYQLEAAFGTAGKPPLTITLEDGRTLRLRGYIDRIDRIGDQVVVMDYKTGTSPFKVEDMRDGRNFQMVIYLLAAQALLQADKTPNAPKAIAGGFFWHTRTGKLSGTLSTTDAKLNADAVIDDATAHLVRYLGDIHAGHFVVEPSKVEEGKCVKYCEYRDLCRMCGLHLHKSSPTNAS